MILNLLFKAVIALLLLFLLLHGCDGLLHLLHFIFHLFIDNHINNLSLLSVKTKGLHLIHSKLTEQRIT